MKESINFLPINSIHVNENKNIVTKSQVSFKNAIDTLEIKFQNLMKNFNNFNDSNILQTILDKNLYVSSNFKSKKFCNDIIVSKNSFKEKNKLSLNNDNININEDKNIFLWSEDNNKEKIIDINTNNSGDINHNLFNENENNLIKKSDDFTKIYITPNINVQNIFINPDNINEISGHINLPNKNDNKLIGNKRNFNDKNKKSTKEDIYNEIKSLYNSIKKNNENHSNLEIYECDNGFFKKYETLIISKPVCIIYFNRKIIEKIYLISDETTIKDNKEIIEVLNKLKKNIKDLYNSP